jgi:hypothetical protein
MGRQLQLATTQRDATDLLRFVGSLGPIRVFQSFGHSIGELWVDDWETRELPRDFYIWPQAFAWAPAYAQTGGPKCPPERTGIFYIANAHPAPVLEFSGSILEQGRYGRIYWAGDFSAPNGLGYDAEAFARLTDSVWRWIRKVGRRLPRAKAYSPYFLPDAWSRHGKVAV